MSRPKNRPPQPQLSRHEMQREDDEDEKEHTQLPLCHLWATDLQTLLDDDTGCELFEQFLREEECDVSELYFVYACRGLQWEDNPSAKKARVIYKNYLKNSTVRAVSNEVKNAIRERLDEEDFVPEVFDEAVRQVIENMTKTTFVRFLESDIYIEHLQRARFEAEGVDSTSPTDHEHSEEFDADKSPAPVNSDSETDVEGVPRSDASKRSIDVISNNDNNNDSFFANQMPTLDEEEELKNSTLLPPRTSTSRKCAQTVVPPPRPPPMSRTIQLQKRQSQLGLQYIEQVIVQPGFRPPPNPYHVKSSYFVPPSAIHSDMQSMSSGNYADLDTDGIRSDHHRRQSDELDRRKCRGQFSVNVRDPHLEYIPRPHLVIDRKEEFMRQSNLASSNPDEFHRQVCERIERHLRGPERKDRNERSDPTEDEMHNQSILDNHVQRVFKTPPAQTPRAPSPPLERQLFAKTSLKNPFYSSSGRLRNMNSNRRDDSDSGMYACSNGVSSAPPMAPPRGRNYPGADSGIDDSVLNASAYNHHENVREWVNRSVHEPSTSKQKNKASVCSGSNRSSKSNLENKKKNQTANNKEPEVVVGYQYEGETTTFVIRMPRKDLRLKEFKAHLTRKGAFRFFFKCPMDEFGSNGVYEEVKDDNQVLPLWEGKVHSQIVPTEHPAPTRGVQEITM